jgi:hypothetical protein
VARFYWNFTKWMFARIPMVTQTVGQSVDLPPTFPLGFGKECGAGFAARIPDIVLSSANTQMEIALNVVWLLLVLPAVWLYQRQEPRRANQGTRFARLGPLLILGCVLVLLFPVISATDDLHAMRFEMEEPGPQRWVKQLAGDRSCPAKLGSLLVGSIVSLCGQHHEKVCGRVYLAPLAFVEETHIYELASRAPPLPLLG